ncbi:MAG: YidH family protein [Solirubrobacterales bacterium]
MSPPSEPDDSLESDARNYRKGAPRRTMLAAERTQLAWWRTAFALLAVGLAIGKIVPQLASEETIWPYTVLGAAFGLYAVVLTLHGSRRREMVERAIETGESFRTSRSVQTALTGGATLLALATTLMIIFN